MTLPSPHSRVSRVGDNGPMPVALLRVWTGSVRRSPMGERFFCYLVGPAADVQADSAGLGAFVDARIDSPSGAAIFEVRP